MTKRDTDILAALLPKLTAHFTGTKAMRVAISRGEARAIVAAIRERAGMKAETPGEKPTQEGALL